MEILNRYSKAVLYNSNLSDVRAAIQEAVKSGADLAGAYLAGAYLARAYLARADLAGAYLAGADLTEANLTRAYLAGADLTRANLARADLARADLARADLTGANLTGADLTGADLTGADGINPYLCTTLLMLLDQPGKIRAYKLVNEKGEGPFNGGIIYTVCDEPYSVPDADTNTSEQCGRGINLATLDWCMKEWKDGYEILVAEFSAQDIAAIPTNTDGKFRVHRCTIVGKVDLVKIGLVTQTPVATEQKDG